MLITSFEANNESVMKNYILKPQKRLQLLKEYGSTNEQGQA